LEQVGPVRLTTLPWGRKAMMIDFICELEVLLNKWPDHDLWTLAQIADYTKTSVPQVVDFLSETLDRDLEFQETLNREEALKVLESLQDKMKEPLEMRRKMQEAARQKAVLAYDQTMEKIRIFTQTKSYRSAYRTLSYYAGCHEKDLPPQMMLEICGECLRLGSKGQANLQELSQWLRKGIGACLQLNADESIETALDFLDANGAYFIDDHEGRGRKVLSGILDEIRRESDGLQYSPAYINLIRDLGLS